uniref:NADH-ubiquinone oxidoreductase chain 2 n=1 Tax=Desis jiaxiangi TaxID=2789892 RepID=A0A8B0Z2Y8_9ARAC|nr:NADH dehydrogenase subunit 2 [Desis jiaxiangi]QTX95124.1 NADH dehydrogenase subunit 2 [Desis jiaxiangi]
MLIPSLSIFVILYVISFYMVLNTDDWFVIWLGMEINMFSFVLLIFRRNNKMCVESCLKYFFIQSLGSAIIMFFFYFGKEMFLCMGGMMMSYKMGIGPFYFWFPSICEGLNWWSNFMLMFFQKIIPLMLLMIFVSWVIWLVILMSLMIGGLGSFNQDNLKRLMAYSSIHHGGWMLLCEMVSKMLWAIYLAMYGLIICPIVVGLSKMKVESMKEIMKWSKKWWFFGGILSMGGIPPLLGFFLKWMTFYFMEMFNILMILYLLMMSILMFYIYMRIVYDLMMGESSNIGWFFMKGNVDMWNGDMFSIVGMMMGFGFMLLMIG